MSAHSETNGNWNVSITSEVLAEFLSESTDRVEVIFTKFVSLVSCNPTIQTLLPLDPQGIADSEYEIIKLTKSGHPMDILRSCVSSFKSVYMDKQNKSKSIFTCRFPIWFFHPKELK